MVAVPLSHSVPVPLSEIRPASDFFEHDSDLSEEFNGTAAFSQERIELVQRAIIELDALMCHLEDPNDLAVNEHLQWWKDVARNENILWEIPIRGF